jgi:hypothetical protein
VFEAADKAAAVEAAAEAEAGFTRKIRKRA